MRELFLSGGHVMWPLLACSFFSLLFSIERMIFWFVTRNREQSRTLEQVIELVGRNNKAEAVRAASAGKDYTLQILYEGLIKPGPHTSMFIALDHAAAHRFTKMKRFLFVFDTIITMSPMLGILGTVMGIIQAFHGIGESLENVSVVAGGISQALITTAFGLIIAIFTLIPYNAFQAQTERAHGRIEDAISKLELAIHEAEEEQEKSNQERRS